MTSYPVHTIESAPERSKPAMQQLQSAFGMIPNLIGAISTSPVLINSLVGLFGNVHGSGAGHWVQQEQPVRLSTLLLAFIKQVGGADHTSD